MTRNSNRKLLLLIAVAGFSVFNLAIFFINHYAVLLAVRFLAGMSAGIVCVLLTG
jgi:predicted MFS family arabinose efflux permease